MPPRPPCPTPGDANRQPAPPQAIVPSDAAGIESAVLYRSIIERAEEIVLVLDRAGRFRYVSPSAERVLGYVPAETVGLPVVQFVHPDDVLAVQGTIAEALARPGEAQRLSDYRVRHADGTWRDFEAMTTNLLDDAGVRGVIVNCHDITERKRMERLLLERSRLARLEAEVGAALAAGGDLDEMLCRCAEILGRSLGAPSVRIWVPVPNSPLLEVRGTAGQHSLLTALPNRVSMGTFPVGAIAQSRETVAVNEFNDARFDDLRDWIEREGVVAFSGSPLIVEGSVVGVLVIFARQPLGTAVAGALGWVAHALAVAIDRALMREALAGQRETVLLRLASDIRNSLDVSAVLQTTVREMAALLQIDRCAFLTFRSRPATLTIPPQESSYWEVVAEVARPELGAVRPHPRRLGGTATGLLPIVLQYGVVTVDDRERERLAPALLKFLEEIGATAMAVVPVMGRRSRDFSVLCCFQEQGARSWNRREVDLLAGVSDQLAVALDQAVLYEDARSAAVRARDRSRKLAQALADLKTAQTRLVQSEKLSSLGQMVAGIAHEINNPVAFIHGNLTYASQYLQDLMALLDAYGRALPSGHPEVDKLLALLDLPFIRDDFAKLLGSMQMGAERIRQIVLSLRNFSHRDRAGMKPTDLHALFEDTLTILQHRLKPRSRHPGIEVRRCYGDGVPLVQCHTGQIGQVLMNLLGNAIDVLEVRLEPGVVEIETSVVPAMRPAAGTQGTQGTQGGAVESVGPRSVDRVRIVIRDNGPGLEPDAEQRLFEPFFTTKPVGKGMGLGLSIVYQVLVEGHGGTIEGRSRPEGGAEFVVEIPVLPSEEDVRRGLERPGAPVDADLGSRGDGDGT